MLREATVVSYAVMTEGNVPALGENLITRSDDGGVVESTEMAR